MTAMATAYSSPSPLPDLSWYGGNLQYLLNITAVGTTSCLLLFLLVKLRSDHRSILGPTALLAKLAAVFHAQIALHCGDDASQFLLIKRSSFLILLPLSLPLNLFAPATPADADDFARTTITHIPNNSPLLRAHFFFMILVVVLAHLSISFMEEKLKLTRFTDGTITDQSPSNPVSMFTIWCRGSPRAWLRTRRHWRSTSSTSTQAKSTESLSRLISAVSRALQQGGRRWRTRSPGWKRGLMHVRSLELQKKNVPGPRASGLSSSERPRVFSCQKGLSSSTSEVT